MVWQDSAPRKEIKTTGLEKIGDIPNSCLSPEHNPPSMIVLEPGLYRYTCPACGNVVEFTVGRTIC